MVNPSRDVRSISPYIKPMTLDAKHAPLLAILLSGGLLLGAWIFQYGFGYAPCTMCYWQRHAHKAVLFLAVSAIGLAMYKPSLLRPMIWLIALGLFGSFAMAFWHVGVEYKWWEGPKTCSAGGNFSGFDPNNPLGGLDGPIKPPACTEAVWHFLGLSMAAWNAIASLAGVGMVLWLSIKGKNHA